MRAIIILLAKNKLEKVSERERESDIACYYNRCEVF